MKQKLMLMMAATLLLGTTFTVNSIAWSFEKQSSSPIPEGQIASQPFESFEKSDDYCEIYNDVNSPYSFYPDFDSGMGIAVYMDPAQCGDFPYPFKITDVHFYLYEHDTTYKWPVAIRVNIRDSDPEGSCLGPQDILYSEDFSIPVDSVYPLMMTLSLSSSCCVSQPFFLEIVYTETRDPAHPHPSLVMDVDTSPEDTCDNWAIYSDLQYYEWYDFWELPVPGDAIIRATGYTSSLECWYWKRDRTNAPSGMPDFDQYQFGGDSVSLCGPVAAANCLWWFNAVPSDTTPPDFIRLLSTYFKCDPYPLGGTYVDSMELGLDQYLIDYGFDLYERTYYQPDFQEMEDSLKKSQDIILLLGFYNEQYEWVGGHFVTMAGVCSDSLLIALSDPARDVAVGGWPGRVRPADHPGPPVDSTLHNDPTYVSQDIFLSSLESPTPGNPHWGLPDYLQAGGKNAVVRFLGQNLQPEQEKFKGHYILGQAVYTEVVYSIMICPGEWYWKPDTTHAPSGMPDFDQNQFGPPDSQAMCGPTAVASCLWWFNAVPEDTTPDDFIRLLSDYFNTDSDSGTYVDSIQAGLERYFLDYDFALNETTYWMPDFYEMEESLKVCQDIILLLGFWGYDTLQQEWIRVGGHFVTMAGVNSEGMKAVFSDPDRDAAVMKTRPGRVRPPEHPQEYDPTLHNDTTHVSHDVYDCTIYPEFPSPGSDKWEIEEYFTMMDIEKYYGINVPPRFADYIKPPSDPDNYVWHTEVEAAIMICPKKPDKVEGEEEGWLTPKDFELYQNYPNPFNNETIIRFNLSKPAEVTLVLYNILGQKVRTLVKGQLEAGPRSVSWDGKDEKENELASGIYFYQLKAGKVTQTKRLVLLK